MDTFYYCLQCEEYSTEFMVEFIDNTPICPFCDDEELMQVDESDAYQ